MGGKTGSAQIFLPGKGWINRHNSSFIGFAPVNNPRIVVVVTLNNTPQQGGIASAPVFAKIAETALRVLQVAGPRGWIPRARFPGQGDDLRHARIGRHGTPR